MALKDILNLAKDYSETREELISEERIKAIMPYLREYIAFWREYPDIFIDFMCGNNPENFKLFFYQRVFLRAAIRHRYFYATFPRAFSKSFLSMLILMTRCILFPGSHAFVTTGGNNFILFKIYLRRSIYMSAKNVLTNFEKIDTEEKAYWLGFLYVDGSVGSKEDKIELGLAEKDLRHVEKFKAFIGLENKICYRESTKSYRYTFRSSKCKQDLIDKGCVPKKSLILKFPTKDQVPDELIRHFIRGYFDGDGWFTNTPDCFQVGFIGTEDFIKGFLCTVEDINKDNKIMNVHRENGAKKYIFGAYQDVLNFLNWIYKDSIIYLDRKYEHYIDFIENGSKYHKTK